MQPGCLACSVLCIVTSGPEAPVDHEGLLFLLADGWTSESDASLPIWSSSSFRPKQNACEYCRGYGWFSSVQPTWDHNTGRKQRLPGLTETIDEMRRRRNNKNKSPDDPFTVLTFPVRSFDPAHVRWPSCNPVRYMNGYLLNCKCGFQLTIFSLVAQGMQPGKHTPTQTHTLM